MKREEKYCRYLLEKEQDYFTTKNYVSFIDPKCKRLNTKFVNNNSCFKTTIEKMFETNIDCKLYDSVVFGEGNESEKIDTIYSSSLQSLLVFCHVNSKRPIKIRVGDDETLEFDEVFFEQKNKVIGYPSSIDVVLVNRKNKAIMFIESKLFEIIRDSYSVMDYNNGKKKMPKVIGVSYLGKNDSSYYSVFGQTDRMKNGFKEIGILLDGVPKEKCELNRADAITVEPINGNNYVYHEGIKQMIAHFIGIINFKKGALHEGCIEDLKNIKFEHYYYLQLYNKLPKFGDEEIANKIYSFEKHVDKVFDVLGELKLNNEGIVCLRKTYQELYKEDKKYFSGLDKIINFYHLKED